MEPLHMNLQEAMHEAMNGKPIARQSWEEQGDGSVLIYVPGREVIVDREPMISFLGEGTKMLVHPHFDRLIGTDTDPQCIIGYTFSQDDIMADDWVVAD